jgi:effector-binding domain-containing protein
VHRGPYEDEGPALAALYAFVAEQGLTPDGPHTEVCVTDPTYVTDPTAAEPGELVTRVAVALAPAGEDAPA